MTTLHWVPKPSAWAFFLPSSASALPPPLSPYSVSSLHKRQNIWGEARSFLVCVACHGCGAFQTPLPRSLCPSLSACLSVRLSVSLCACAGYRIPGSSPVWAACHIWGYSMYSLPSASYFIFVFPSPWPISGHVFPFFLICIVFISTCCLMFDRLGWAKAFKHYPLQGGGSSNSTTFHTKILVQCHAKIFTPLELHIHNLRPT